MAMRAAHPAWGPSTIVWHLEREGFCPVPGRSSVYRGVGALTALVAAEKRRRKRSEYKRWERGRSMELWQMDIVGRFFLADGPELSRRDRHR